MQKMHANHPILRLPSNAFSKTSEDKSKYMFKRVLSSWAQDLLVQLQKEKVSLKYQRAA